MCPPDCWGKTAARSLRPSLAYLADQFWNRLRHLTSLMKHELIPTAYRHYFTPLRHLQMRYLTHNTAAEKNKFAADF